MKMTTSCFEELMILLIFNIVLWLNDSHIQGLTLNPEVKTPALNKELWILPAKDSAHAMSIIIVRKWKEDGGEL